MQPDYSCFGDFIKANPRRATHWRQHCEIHDLEGDRTPLVSLPAYEIVDLEWSGDNRFITAGNEAGTDLAIIFESSSMINPHEFLEHQYTTRC